MRVRRHSLASWGSGASYYNAAEYLGITYARDRAKMTDARFKCGKNDTSPEARRVQYDLYRRMSLGRKLELAFDMYEMGR
jgi:hypothetical protein